MTETTRTKTDIRPSTQDPISRWLDIFIPMTGLPRARQTEIRAELDDHLRARTADLMITGQPEPEAVQQAVNELGETAHLARQFRTALKPKRNTLMHTALIAAAGAAITLGAFSLTSHNAAAPGHLHGAHTTEQVTDPSGGGAHIITGLRGQTFGGLFDSFSEFTDVPVLVYWDRLEKVGIDRDTELGLDVDALPSHLLYRALRERTESIDGDTLAVEDTPDLIEFSLQSHFDRRSVDIRPHDIGALVYEDRVQGQDGRRATEADGLGVLRSIMDLVESESWKEHGGDLISARVVGTSLIIEAPERIHSRIDEVIQMMDAEVQRYREARQRAHAQAADAAAARAAESARQRAEAVDSLRTELDKQVHTIVMLEARKRSVQDLINEINTLSQPFNRIEGENDEQAKARRAEYKERRDTEIPGLLIELDRINLELEDALAYRATTRDRLIGLTTQPIMSNEQITQRQQQDMTDTDQGPLGSVHDSDAD